VLFGYNFNLIRNFNYLHYLKKKEGTQLPDLTLYEDNPGKKVQVRELFAGKKGILIGVPG